MLLEIIFIICLLISIFIWVIGDKYDSIAGTFLGICGTIVNGLGLIIVTLSFMTLEEDFNYTESQYYNLKEQIEYVSKDDIVTKENLRNQVLDMNNKIDRHKCYKNNIFIGDFYSEKIGNLPKLKWRSN